MKKFLLSLVAMMATLGMFGQQQRISMYFVDAAGAQVRQMTATVGQEFQEPRLMFSNDSAEYYVRVEYTSTNPDVAAIDMVTGDVTPLAAGTTTITAVSGQTERYYSARAQYNLIVERDTTQIEEPVCPEAHFFLDGEMMKVLTIHEGESVSLPTLIGSTGSVYTGYRAYIDSTNNAMITADNMIYGVHQGMATLFATMVITNNGQVLTCSYELPIQVMEAETPAIECPSAVFMTEAGQVIETMTMYVGETTSVPMLMGGAGSTLRMNAMTIEGIRVAELTADNLIHATGAGQALFIGNYQHSVNGQTINCEYTFSIFVEEQPQKKLDPELGWSDTIIITELGMPFNAPTLYNPYGVQIDKYYSTDRNVAEVDEATGAVTIKGVGNATIFCESMENETYSRGAASYMIYVSTIGLKVKGINVTSANAHDVLGDGIPSVTFEVSTRTLDLYGWNIDATGLTNLDAMIEDELSEAPLTIRLHGVCSITNVPMCIKSVNGAVIIMGATGRETLTLNGTDIAVQAAYFKIHQCNVDAQGSLAGLKLGVELGVSRNSHLLAQSNGVAAQCNNLILAEGEDGVAILTPGVRFEQKKGFMTSDNKVAKLVEIGKVPVVAPADEVTTIDFSATDPDGNETVLFSTSVSDTYNETTGQLEISTQLTDAQVEEALETLVPGSSAWLAMLPGSLVFDIPAGEGKVRVNCMTLPGYTLQVKIEGQAAVSVQMVALGWAEVTYNVAAPMHVVIYLHAPANITVPARMATNMEEAVSAHAFIAAVEIAPKTAATAIDLIEMRDADKQNQKLLHNGQLYIIRGEKVYSASGIMIE